MAPRDPELEIQMLTACQQGDADKFRELLKTDINLAYATVQSGTGAGYSALQKLAGKGTPEMAQQLLDLGVPVDLRKEGARTPLQLSAMSGNIEMVKFLVSKGADVNAVEKYFGWTPLFMACYMGDSEKFQEIAKFLIKNKADLQVKDLKLKVTPLGAAKRKKHAEMVKILEAAGATE